MRYPSINVLLNFCGRFRTPLCIVQVFLTLALAMGFAAAAPYLVRCELRGAFVPDGAFTDSATLTVTLSTRPVGGSLVETKGRVFLEKVATGGTSPRFNGSWKTDGFLANVPGLLSTTEWNENQLNTRGAGVPVMVNGTFDIPFDAPVGHSTFSIELDLDGRRVSQYFSNYPTQIIPLPGELGLKVVSIRPAGDPGTLTHSLISDRTRLTTFTTDGAYQPTAFNLLSDGVDVASVAPKDAATEATGYSAARHTGDAIIRLEAYTYDDWTIFQSSNTRMWSNTSAGNFQVIEHAPTVVTPPASASVDVNQPHTFSVTATGESLAYRWFKDDEVIPGENGSQLVIPAVQVADAGKYTVEVSNSFGVRLSAPAVLTVVTPPVNDAFAAAILVGDPTGSVTGTNRLATKEVSEPGTLGGGRSVWWKWVAPVSGRLKVTTAGSSFDTVLQVYKGSALDSLILLGQDDESGPGTTSELAVNVAAGTLYYFRVEGYANYFGNIVLGWSPVPPENDHFAAAASMTGVAGSATGVNTLATREALEPTGGLLGDRSVWWKWVAPFSGKMKVNTLGSDFDTVMQVYSGGGLDSLVLVGSDHDSGPGESSELTVTASVGSTYYFRVDGYGNATGGISLNWYPLPPGNDHFADAIVLTTREGTTTGGNRFATLQPSEPVPSPGNGGLSVWWKWVAPESGGLKVTTAGSGFDTLVQIYTGSSLEALVLVGQDDDGGPDSTSSLTVPVTAGTTYYFRVQGYRNEVGDIVLNWAPGPLVPDSPANDHFANATLLNGSEGSVEGSSVSATFEDSEPESDIDSERTVWWKWVAPVSGTVTVSTIGSDWDTFLEIYSGNSLDDLFLLGSDDDDGGDLTSRLSVPVIAGEVYYFRVGGYDDEDGDITLNWNLETDLHGFYLHVAQLPEGQRGTADDPDHDGIPNLLEFALGLNLLEASSEGLPVSARTATGLSFTYFKARYDLTYIVETTDNLNDPLSWTTQGVDQGTEDDDGMVTATMDPTGPKRFVRLRVVLPDL